MEKKKSKYDFFMEKEITIKLSQMDIYEIMSGLWLEQQAYGFNAPNQVPSELRKKFKKLLSGVQEKD